MSAMRGCRAVLVLVTTLALVSGCASADGGVGNTTSPGTKNKALKLWSNFPAGSSPRPLVLTGPTVSDPSTGFRTAGAKVAYVSGRFSVATRLPTTSMTWRRTPLITAAQALTDLRGSEHGGPPSSKLVITRVRLGRATFSTDRGKRVLPAWNFTFAGVRHSAGVLAVAPANRWPKAAPASAYTDFTAKITPGGQTVTITFVGAAVKDCRSSRSSGLR